MWLIGPGPSRIFSQPGASLLINPLFAPGCPCTLFKAVARGYSREQDVPGCVQWRVLGIPATQVSRVVNHHQSGNAGMPKYCYFYCKKGTYVKTRSRPNYLSSLAYLSYQVLRRREDGGLLQWGQRRPRGRKVRHLFFDQRLEATFAPPVQGPLEHLLPSGSCLLWPHKVRWRAARRLHKRGQLHGLDHQQSQTMNSHNSWKYKLVFVYLL